MKVIIYDKNTTAIGADNPLPVTFGRDGDAFDATVYSNDASTAKQVVAATSGSSIYITDVVISASKAMNIQLQDSDATPVLRKIYLAANAPFDHTFSTPLEVAESKALNMLASLDGDITVTVSGYTG